MSILTMHWTNLPKCACQIFCYVIGFIGCGSVSWCENLAEVAIKCLEVPEEYPSIQAAIDAAEDGETILIAPGVYHESLRISGKSVILASWYLTTKETKYIKQTVLDGSIVPDPDPEDDIDAVVDAVILIEPDAGPQTTILGFTIRDGDDGISCHAKSRILFNHFVNNKDAIDYEGGGGECRFNTFVANDDDAIDLDLACEVLVSNNILRDNDDDGIEIRLHDYEGPTLEIIIRDNTITGNGEDGIQVIDYPGHSDRRITIERNLIAENAMAGIGFMSDGITLEDYRGTTIPEPIALINNTICRNSYGLSGGGNVQVINNLFVENLHTPLKNVNGTAKLSHNLLWENGAEPIDSDLKSGLLIREDPQLDETYKPFVGSLCIDRGTTQIELRSQKNVVHPQAFRGSAPDLGAFEIR
ncbi:right-handed parallel beta-helix repeat-containing protein [Bythopirellula goksoeyrii]|uniref:Right handed beta helix domain-containing protein n=1 Tax=Bythopirellula goksoeyrii TaxID=1400387 RepID=A0A5B9Q1T2_9BACT|nr:right-handed parallel beta-helix repeat-containing protein [Bythopirellula goksoeyrii]QEG32914.1 hypothetical protein Pr1d_01750 [Bythopirellula goksoeyrii]